MSTSRAYQLVRLRRNGHTVELLARPGAVMAAKAAAASSSTPLADYVASRLDELCYSQELFTNHSKGDRASHAVVAEVFGATLAAQPRACVVDVLVRGEVHLSADERRARVERRRRDVLNYVHKYYVEPRTGYPAPIARLEAAADECKFRFDVESVSRETLAAQLVRACAEVGLPLRREELRGEVTLAMRHVGAASAVMQAVRVESSSFTSTHARYSLQIVPGELERFIAELNRVTKGEYDLVMENAQPPAAAVAAAVAADVDNKRNKGKAKKGGANKHAAAVHGGGGGARAKKNGAARQ